MVHIEINTEYVVGTQVKENELCNILPETTFVSACKIRLNLSLPKEFMIYIKELAKINHQTLTGAIISIITFHKTMHDFVKNGYKVSIEDPEGKSHYLLINATV